MLYEHLGKDAGMDVVLAPPTNTWNGNDLQDYHHTFLF